MEDKTTHFNGLTPAEDERLAWLLEECAEVIQVAGKIHRHGYDSHHPSDAKKTTNRALLLQEIADVATVVAIMLETGDLPHPPTNEQMMSKRDRLAKYAHHQ